MNWYYCNNCDMNKFIVRLPKGNHLKRKNSSNEEEKAVAVTEAVSAPIPNHSALPFPSSSSSASQKMQMQLDFGQKSLGASEQCKKCGLLYMLHDSDDQKQHAQFCKDTQKPLVIPSLTGHQVLASEHNKSKREDEFSIISVKTGQKLHREALHKVVERMEREVGTSEHFVEDGRDMYLYLNGSRHVLGAMVLQTVSGADLHKVRHLKELSELESTAQTAVDDRPSKRHKSEKPFLGVRLVWVHEQHQRRGIASKMLDVARSHFLFGNTFTAQQVAFSQPTDIGFQLAKAYSDSDEVLCYSHS